MRDDESDMSGNLTHIGPVNPATPKQMTADQAREWMQDHWDADEIGTDLDCEVLDEAFEAVFGRLPEDDGDAFGALKNHFLNN